MTKIIKIIIKNCRDCPYSFQTFEKNWYCKGYITKKNPLGPKLDNIKKGIPRWCGLKDYKK